MSLPSVSMSRRPMIALVCLFAIGLAACAPAATPTATPVPPTDAPEEVEEEVETVEPTDAPEEVETEEATGDDTATEEPADESEDETEEAEDESEDEATDDADEGGGGAAGVDGFPATVSVSVTRVREAPSNDAAVLVELAQGDAVTVTGRTANSSYAYVTTEDGTVGWVAMQTIRLANLFANPPVMTPQP